MILPAAGIEAWETCVGGWEDSRGRIDSHSNSHVEFGEAAIAAVIVNGGIRRRRKRGGVGKHGWPGGRVRIEVSLEDESMRNTYLLCQPPEYPTPKLFNRK